ncbi:MAG TPA: 3-dehydroquinate synthase [Dehalococcoidia bacterium]|nr:3-dehydroquinate synthase [Dehalococcoidia bacterium]
MSSAPASSTVPVHLDVNSRAGRYAVEIAPGLSAALATLLDAAGAPARRIIVSNPTVWRLHGSAFGGVTADEPILIPDGERFKTLQTTGRIYDALLRLETARSTALVALGGGVVGDTAGFAAATFLRGIPLVQVPTTLLAQVDSAIGGKVGVNHAAGKNLIGAFHPPAIVAVDPQLLVTLPRREFRAGLYEVIKYGMIASRPLFDRVGSTLRALFARDPAALMPVIAESCAIKAAVVEEDERERGPRRALNFGHTAGHALEAVTKYRRFRHGEAVAYGMLAAAAVAVARGAMRDEDRRTLTALITQMGPLPAIADLSSAAVIEATRRDKKIVDGQLHFVLATAIGRTEIVTDVSEAELARALREIGLRA